MKMRLKKCLYNQDIRGDKDDLEKIHHFILFIVFSGQIIIVKINRIPERLYHIVLYLYSFYLSFLSEYTHLATLHLLRTITFLHEEPHSLVQQGKITFTLPSTFNRIVAQFRSTPSPILLPLFLHFRYKNAQL
uniref:Ovule protein n=1 Tax=Heterorhabditis bacteriophora TaxID=37862 RepID=A0A1I7W6N2_HETBA